MRWRNLFSRRSPPLPHFIFQSRVALIDQVATWGYPIKLVHLLQQCQAQGAIGLPMTCTLRIIHVTSVSTACVEAFAQGPVLAALKSTLEPALHKDAAFILTAMLRLFEVRVVARCPY